MNKFKTNPFAIKWSKELAAKASNKQALENAEELKKLL